MLGEIGKPDQLDEMARELASLAGTDTVDLERELDIAEHGAPRQQAEVLEHHAGVLARAGDRRAGNGDAALVGGDQSGREPQQRGLPAAARPQQRDQLALAHRRVDAIERHHQLRAGALPGHRSHRKELADVPIDHHAIGRRRRLRHGAAISSARGRAA
jgi:hypothetical protein